MRSPFVNCNHIFRIALFLTSKSRIANAFNSGSSNRSFLFLIM